MKKTLFPFLVALMLGCAAAQAQTIEPVGESEYCIISGDMSLTVDAARGGKILSFKYKDKEVLSQTRFPNSFGSTFWTSPQAQWNWPPVPEYDSKPYKANLSGDVLVLTGEKSERFGYRIGKKFHVCPNDGAIVITYTIFNESGETRQVAPWEISRVPNGGVLFFDAPAVEPGNNMALIPFQFRDGAAWYVMDEAGENRKINANGKGWLAFSSDGVLFVKKFPDLADGEAAPAEAEIQVYVNTGKTFVEIEEQGAYTTLAPGEKLDWTVRWYLLPQPSPDVPSAELLKLALGGA